jgi:hypothetical protein
LASLEALTWELMCSLKICHSHWKKRMRVVRKSTVGTWRKSLAWNKSGLRMVVLKMLLRATPMKEFRMGQVITMLVLVKKF